MQDFAHFQNYPAPGSTNLSALINEKTVEVGSSWMEKPHLIYPSKDFDIPLKRGSKDSLAKYSEKDSISSFTSSAKDRLLELRKILGIKPPPEPKSVRHAPPKPNVPDVTMTIEDDNHPEVATRKFDPLDTLEYDIVPPTINGTLDDLSNDGLDKSSEEIEDEGATKPKERGFFDKLLDFLGGILNGIADVIEKIWNLLPDSVKGILKAGVKGIARIAGTIAVVTLAVALIGESAFVILAFMLGYSLGSALLSRYKQVKVLTNGKMNYLNYFDILSAAILDVANLTPCIENAEKRSIITGTAIDKPEEDRWEDATSCLIDFFATFAGILGSGPAEVPVDTIPPVEPSIPKPTPDIDFAPKPEVTTDITPTDPGTSSGQPSSVSQDQDVIPSPPEALTPDTPEYGTEFKTKPVLSEDGRRRLGLDENGKCEVCASPCDDIREKYKTVMDAESEADIKRIENDQSLSDAQKLEALKPIEQRLAAKQLQNLNIKPSYKIGESDGGPGTWKNETTPAKGQNFQQKVTGAPPNTEYVVEGPNPKGKVKFDGYDPQRNVLLDAKEFNDFPKIYKGRIIGEEKILAEARRQVNSNRNGTKIEWDMADQANAQIVRDLLIDNGITDIEVVSPPKFLNPELSIGKNI